MENEKYWTEKELKHQKSKDSKKCFICNMTYSPLQIFRWNAEAEKHNKQFHDKRVCHFCYINLKEYSYKITAEGKIIKGFKFHI